MALRKPIISTNVGGIAEMITDGEDGILIKYDEDEMYASMKNFLIDSALVNKITEGTKHAFVKFDEKKIYEEVTEVFENQYQLKLNNLNAKNNYNNAIL